MKTAFLILFLAIFTQLSANIVFLEFPANLHFFGRDKATGQGQVHVKGYYQQYNPDMFQSLKMYFYRGNEVVGLRIVDLSPDIDSTWFHVYFNIPAELAEYRLATYGYSENDSTLIRQAERLVCGDVLVIQGQSNAEAKKRGPQSVAYLSSDFIRVFGSGHNEPAQMQADLQWRIGQGDGDKSTPGNCGQWGLFLARKLIDSLHIPVAIFNGAHGGTGINFFQRDEHYKTQLNSNYSRLYKRINDAGLIDFVHVILWSQGEHDAASNQSTTVQSYQNKFNLLYNAWHDDFPNLDRIIMFQTAKGCETPTEKMQIVTEAQRQLAENNPLITLIPTHGIPFRIVDSCHFEFEAGYRRFADRAFYALMTGTYNQHQGTDLSAPKLLSIETLSSSALRLKFDKEVTVLDSLSTDFFLNNDYSYTSNKIKAHGFYLDVSFSHEITPFTQLSYAGNYTLTPAFRAENGVELPRFHLLNVQNPLELKKNDFLSVVSSPNPTGETIFLNQALDITYVKLTDHSGIVFTEVSDEIPESISVSALPSGIYFMETNLGIQKIVIAH